MASGGEISASGYWPKAANPVLQKSPRSGLFHARSESAGYLFINSTSQDAGAGSVALDLFKASTAIETEFDPISAFEFFSPRLPWSSCGQLLLPLDLVNFLLAHRAPIVLLNPVIISSFLDGLLQRQHQMIALNLLAAEVNEANFQVNRRLVFSLYAEAEQHDSTYGWAVFARLSYVRKEVLAA
ncbi:hypothetical protein JN757_13025 [Pseudomonas granadensis]|uniref:Uncharacterized protein n=1 Tax=Pseudomonas granadensis TaxID=1421430 RepID=A0ABX7GMH8_9PSED|nr:hypothetical protein [Pseudomonas granadensis]QRK86638.1 hypothetical protein JN757_13025 [Pseudomonas granadensis]